MRVGYTYVRSKCPWHTYKYASTLSWDASDTYFVQPLTDHPGRFIVETYLLGNCKSYRNCCPHSVTSTCARRLEYGSRSMYRTRIYTCASAIRQSLYSVCLKTNYFLWPRISYHLSIYIFASSRHPPRRVTPGWTICGMASCQTRRLQLRAGDSSKQLELRDRSKFVPLLAFPLPSNRRLSMRVNSVPHYHVVHALTGSWINVGRSSGEQNDVHWADNTLAFHHHRHCAPAWSTADHHRHRQRSWCRPWR